MGFPAAKGSPVVVDFATIQVAGGKVAIAQAKGEPLPLGWIIDKHGNSSTHPEDYYNGGALLPFGAHKGFGVMVAIEILGRILAGADAYSNTDRVGVYFRHAGISLITIESGVFSSSSEFAARTTALVDRIRAVSPAPGTHEVMAPGDFEHRARTSRIKEGVQIPEFTWSEIVKTAESLGVKI